MLSAEEPAACCLLPAACCLLPAACCLLSPCYHTHNHIVALNVAGFWEWYLEDQVGPVDEGGGHGLYGKRIQQNARTGCNREDVVCFSIPRDCLTSLGYEGLGSWLLQGRMWATPWNFQAALDSCNHAPACV